MRSANRVVKSSSCSAFSSLPYTPRTAFTAAYRTTPSLSLSAHPRYFKYVIDKNLLGYNPIQAPRDPTTVLRISESTSRNRFENTLVKMLSLNDKISWRILPHTSACA